MTQPEALRLADALETQAMTPPTLQAAYELRRLHADNEKKSEAIQRLWKERAELRVQRDELLEALKLADAMLRGANMDSAFVQKKMEAAITKAEGKT